MQQQGFQRVLIVATTAIGDAVLCTPLIDSLKAARPDLHIGFWVSHAAVSLFEGRHGLGAVIPYYGKYRKVSSTLKTLKEHAFDVALVANANDPDVIPMIWWSGCKRIIRRPQRNTIYSFMIANPDMLSPNHTTGHAIDRNLQFCDLLGLARGDVRTSLDILPKAKARIRQLIFGAQAPVWVIHPGASKSKKQWGAEKYGHLAKMLLREPQGTVLITGSKAEEGICSDIEKYIGGSRRVLNFAGKLPLDEFAALVKSTNLFISGDTGPFHIAMAVGTPTVTLFAPWDIGSSADINGPYFYHDLHIVIETKMNQPISTIPVEAVYNACQPFLKSRHS